MRRILIPFSMLVLCVALTGCPKDSRAQRGSSLLCAKTDTAKQELEDAKTPEAKIKVAEDYFETAPGLVRALDDYMHGREPEEKPVQ